MVRLEETTDEYFQKAQAAEDADEWQDDDESDFSDESEDEKTIHEETLLERIYALRDIVPPSTRNSISSTVSTATNYAFAGGSIFGRLAWVITTSALLVGLPFALAVEDEARLTQQEREFQAQQSGASMLGGGSSPYAPQQPGQPQAGGQQAPQGLRPPGF
ncbi:mitochondrial import translocase, subunit Tom22, partial [Tilletiaria anomala UBC 951]